MEAVAAGGKCIAINGYLIAKGDDGVLIGTRPPGDFTLATKLGFGEALGYQLAPYLAFAAIELGT